jgi:hypothetical protein
MVFAAEVGDEPCVGLGILCHFYDNSDSEAFRELA